MSIVRLILIVAVSLAIFVQPVYAWPSDYLDPEEQRTGNASIEQAEHWVFYKQYLWAIFPNQNKYFTWYAAPSIHSYAKTGIDRWNAYTPNAVEGAVETSSSAADLRFLDLQCPAFAVPGCFMIDAWGSNSGFDLIYWN